MAIYDSFNDLLGIENTLQIGSYPRYTAITPLHDLDILYILGKWDANSIHAVEAVNDLYKKIRNGYRKPPVFDAIDIKIQTHSVTVAFRIKGEEIFSVDIVPAYEFGLNEFKQSKYKVPEILKRKSHSERAQFYEQKKAERQEISWIDSDPRGYISVATAVGKNPDFRKTVKIAKRWKNNLQGENEDLKLKSFHLEQVITCIFQENPRIEIFDAVFKFFFDLPDTVLVANRIADRANPDKYIDDYVADISKWDKEMIQEARDGFLAKLESMQDGSSMDVLLAIHFYERGSAEKFMFDFNIPVLTDEKNVFLIDGFLKKKAGFREYRYPISAGGGVVDRHDLIKFQIVKNNTGAGFYKWKVKNDRSVERAQWRGEITDNQTSNDPEKALYDGRHFVEAYAIKDNVCIAKASQNVILKP